MKVQSLSQSIMYATDTLNKMDDFSLDKVVSVIGCIEIGGNFQGAHEFGRKVCDVFRFSNSVAICIYINNDLSKEVKTTFLCKVM